jgi:hypothetical protein
MRGLCSVADFGKVGIHMPPAWHSSGIGFSCFPLSHNCLSMQWRAPSIEVSQVVLAKVGQPQNNTDEAGDCFHQRLRAAFKSRHMLHQHSKCPALGKVPATKYTKSRCRLAGMCICGSTLESFHDHFVCALQPLFVKGSSYKARAEDAMLVAKVTSIGGDTMLWLHIAMVNQRSWVLGLLRLEPDPGDYTQALARRAGHLALRACRGLEEIGDIPDVWEALGAANGFEVFRPLDLKHPFEITMFQIVDDPRLLEEFCPRQVEVELLLAPRQFWAGASVEAPVPLPHDLDIDGGEAIGDSDVHEADLEWDASPMMSEEEDDEECDLEDQWESTDDAGASSDD